MRKMKKFYNASIHSDWTPVFETQRTFIVNYKTFQRSQFPVTPASGKTVWKAEGATVDKVVVDLSQKQTKKIPHVHYVAFSRVKKLEDLYILNMNEAAMALDDDVNIEMQRLRTKASLELCYVPLYKIDPGKTKIAFNNARSLHKLFKDVEFEPNVLAADVIGFAETRLCSKDENVHFALKRFRLIRLDDTERDKQQTISWTCNVCKGVNGDSERISEDFCSEIAQVFNKISSFGSEMKFIVVKKTSF